MNRRWFLSRLAALGPAVVATPAIVEALMPRRMIFLPPRLAMSAIHSGNWSNELPTQVDLTEESLLQAMVRMRDMIESQGAIFLQPTYRIVTPREYKKLHGDPWNV
jgi:hypothetical protein